MNKIKAILIDDEIHCLDTLEMLLSDCCPQVDILDKCVSGKKAIESIKMFNPSLVFLDIEMPSMSGFELLEELKETQPAVIFTTSYDQYAIKAIRFSALDYLLKPISREELKAAVKKVELQNKLTNGDRLLMLMNQLQHKGSGIKKIAVPTIEGYELISIDEVTHFEADDNYTRIFLKKGEVITASRTLKEIEELLSDFDFFVRIHHSFIVNLNEVTKYIKGEGGYLTLQNGSTINVSRSRKEMLLRILQNRK